MRGKMQLRIEGDGSVLLPYPWSEAGAVAALPRIQQIFKRAISGNLSLEKAAQSADTASSKQEIDWDELITEFRDERPAAGDETWRKKYLPVLSRVVELFTTAKKRPSDGTALCIKVLRQWEQGTRQRQIMRQKLYAFLEWAVERGHLKACYSPPKSLSEPRKAKRVGYALSDPQILQLLEGTPDERWRFAIQLCAVYGLRPEELRYLRIKGGANGNELWTIYRKSKGGRKGEKTEPRRVNALQVTDIDGNKSKWNLEERFAAGETLPPLGKNGHGAESLTTYLKRRKVWQLLREEAKHQGEVLTAYAFRHRYAKASHAAGLPIANIAQSMGHTIEVHLSSYARFTPDATADLYAQVNAVQVNVVKDFIQQGESQGRLSAEDWNQSQAVDV
ncbi:Phage integrase family protein [Prochlorococcus marinus str. MIT 1342]|uniref:tyrosine-type recombinase/integrase n=1 Tax=Prochlorococcus TaxID=1218 RepID=UPI0007B3BC0C|nr:tyrosine-type recombinase/integrase [Prochlorococcus marinus]KZR84747.1 Phage integrase family protein [Prochlorococcus marinus str. MIT 1342]